MPQRLGAHSRSVVRNSNVVQANELANFLQAETEPLASADKGDTVEILRLVCAITTQGAGWNALQAPEVMPRRCAPGGHCAVRTADAQEGFRLV